MGEVMVVLLEGWRWFCEAEMVLWQEGCLFLVYQMAQWPGCFFFHPPTQNRLFMLGEDREGSMPTLHMFCMRVEICFRTKELIIKCLLEMMCLGIDA